MNMSSMVTEQDEDEEWREEFELITSNRFLDADTKGHGAPEPCGCASKGLCCNDDRCINYSTQTECVSSQCGNKCTNQRFGKKQWRDIMIRKTPGKGHGLFANEDIEEGSFVAEYCGEIISEKAMAARFKKQKTERHLFMQTISPGVYLDGQEAGSLVRFINHSCEPNAIHDRWVVNGRMCIGVFTTRAVSKGEELSFDYRWEYNQRRPTRCYCGTESCRGFLEILTEEQKKLYELRHGQWKKGSESLACAAADGKDVNEWLVGKRIKVYWVGNSKFWECDVESYNREERKHVCYYIADGQREKEMLVDNYVSSETGEPAWMLLDETAEEITIHRKTKSDELEGLTIVDNDDHYNGGSSQTKPFTVAGTAEGATAGSGSNHGSPQARPFVSVPAHAMKVRVSVDVDFSTAQHIVLQTQASNAPGPVDSADVWRRFSMAMVKFYPDVKCLLPLDLTEGTLPIVLFGPQDQAQRVVMSIEKSAESSRQANASRTMGEAALITQLQSAMLTNDWRLALKENSSSSSSKPVGSESLSGAEELENRVLGSIGRACAKKDVRSLSLSCSNDQLTAAEKAFGNSSSSSSSGSGSGSGSGSPRKNGGQASLAVERSLLESLSKLGRKLDLPVLTTAHALTLLLRFLRFGRQGDDVVRDASSLVAASMMLAQKARNGFKPKKMKDLVANAYCVVFKRPSADPEFATAAIVDMVIKAEESMLRALRYDLFVPDVMSLVFSYWCQAMQNSSSSSSSSQADEDAARGGFSDACGTYKREMGALAVMVATHMPTLWMTMPVDTALMACLIIERVCIYISRDALMAKPPALLLAMWKTATFGMHIPYRQLMFFIAETCGALSGMKIDEYPSVFKNIVSSSGGGGAGGDSKEDNDTDDAASRTWSRLLDSVCDTLDRWFHGDQLVLVTLDDQEMAFDGSAPCRLRLPHIPVPEDGSEIALSFQERADHQCGGTKAIAREVYLTNAASSGLDSATLSHTKDTYFSSPASGSSGSPSNKPLPEERLRCSIRRWPSRKEAAKEVKWAAGLKLNSVGVSPSAVRDLCMMQQVHYYAPLLRRNKEWARKHGEENYASIPAAAGKEKEEETTMDVSTCPYLSVVLGVSTVSGQFGLPKMVKHSSSKSPSKPADKTTAVDGEGSPRKTSRTNGAAGSSSGAVEEDDDDDEMDIFDFISSNNAGDANKAANARPSQSFLVMPRLEVSLDSLLPHIQHATKLKAPWLSASLALSMCHDVLAAVSYLTSTGYYLKWLSTDQFFMNSHGRLVLTGLQGAVAAREESETMLAFRSAEKSSPSKLMTGASDSNSNKDGDNKKRKREKEGSSAGPPMPSLPSLHMSAPEIILGGSASSKSGVYSAGIMCSYILTGKSPIKTGSSEEKHMQYIYRTLGTPKKEGYKSFSNLPLAAKYGRHIVQEGKEPAEGRNRMVKAFREIVPPHILRELSHGDSSHASDAGDSGHVLDLLAGATKLVPHQRSAVHELLTMPMFEKNAKALKDGERRANLLGLLSKVPSSSALS